MPYLFDKLSYRDFSISPEELTIIAPAPFGRQSVIEIANAITGGGIVQNRITSNVVETKFQSSRDLVHLAASEIAHSDWFISFDNGTRSFFDFDDDFAVTLFDESMAWKLAQLPIGDFYEAAVDERRIFENINAPDWAKQRFDVFLSRALTNSGDTHSGPFRGRNT